MGDIQLRGQNRLGGGCPGTPAPTQTGQEHPLPCRRSALGSFGSGEGTAVAASRCPVGLAWHLSTSGAPTCILGGLPCTRTPPAQHLCPAMHPKLYGALGCPRRTREGAGPTGPGTALPSPEGLASGSGSISPAAPGADPMAWPVLGCSKSLSAPSQGGHHKLQWGVGSSW